jgi:hypothetical protein
LLFQIAVKNGVVQDWGLVEFKTAEDAEVVVNSRVLLRGQPIREAAEPSQNCAPTQGPSRGLQAKIRIILEGKATCRLHRKSHKINKKSF